MTDSEFIEGKEVSHDDPWTNIFTFEKKAKGLAPGVGNAAFSKTYKCVFLTERNIPTTDNGFTKKSAPTS